MNSTITDQMDQIEKPTCSAKIDQIRLRLAVFGATGVPGIDVFGVPVLDIAVAAQGLHGHQVRVNAIPHRLPCGV